MTSITVVKLFCKDVWICILEENRKNLKRGKEGYRRIFTLFDMVKLRSGNILIVKFKVLQLSLKTIISKLMVT